MRCTALLIVFQVHPHLHALADEACTERQNDRVCCSIAGLAKLPLVSINLDTVETNIIIFQLKPGAPDKAVFLRNLRERHGVLMSGFLKGVRAVTHFDVTAEDCKYALLAVEECLQLIEVHTNGEMNGKAKKELHQKVNGSLKGYE